MTCATCAVRIERVLGRQEGVSRAAVNLAATMAEVDVAPGTDVTRLMQAVEKIGYGIKPAQEEPRDVQEHYGEDERVQWRRFWIAAVLTVPVMVLAMFADFACASVTPLAALHALPNSTGEYHSPPRIMLATPAASTAHMFIAGMGGW